MPREIAILCRRKGPFSSYTLVLKHIFTKFTRRQQDEWNSYGASVPALILLVPNEFTNRWFCQYLRIAAIIVLDCHGVPQTHDPLHWERSPRNHFPEVQSEELRSSIFYNLQLFPKESVLFYIWLPPKNVELHVSRLGTIFYNFIIMLKHWKQWESSKTAQGKLDFARSGFYFLGTPIFNSLPLSLRNINSKVLFGKSLDDFYL